jgi:hypothetical protein
MKVVGLSVSPEPSQPYLPSQSASRVVVLLVAAQAGPAGLTGKQGQQQQLTAPRLHTHAAHAAATS